MLTTEQAITDFLNHCKYEKNLGLKTIKFYTIDLKQFLDYITEEAYPSTIKDIDKYPLKGYLRKLSKWKPKTVKRKMSTIKAMFNYLEFEDLITINPIRKMRISIKEPMMLPKALNKAEAEQIFKSAYQLIAITPNNKYAYMESIRNAAIIETLFATGARVSEVANLKVRDLDLKTGTLTIYGKGSKERIIHICNLDTLAILNKYYSFYSEKINSNAGFMWVNRLNKKLSDQSIRTLVRNLSESAQISKKVTPHVFRHTFATLLLENDVDIKYIQSMLGHSSIVTTQIYTHVNKEKQKQLLKDKHPREEFSSVFD